MKALPLPAAAFIASVSKVASFALLISHQYRDWCTFSMAQLFRLGSTEWELRILPVTYTGSWSLVADSYCAFRGLHGAGKPGGPGATSVRRLLAYSAIAHAGYILLGAYRVSFSLFLPQHTGACALLRSHLRPDDIGAFGVVGVVERATGTDRMDSFLGLHKRNPLLAAVLLVLFLSLAGIPPLVGFWAKFNLFAAVLGVSAGPVPFALVALAVALSAVSLYYYLQVLKRAYVMQAVDDTPIKAHPVTMAVLVLIAAAVVILGCFPAVLSGWIDSFIH